MSTVSSLRRACHSKLARHSPEAKPMADGPTCHCEARAGRQGEAAWGTSGQVTIGMMEYRPR